MLDQNNLNCQVSSPKGDDTEGQEWYRDFASSSSRDDAGPKLSSIVSQRGRYGGTGIVPGISHRPLERRCWTKTSNLKCVIEKQFNPVIHFLKLCSRNTIGRKYVNNIPQRPDQDPMLYEVAIDIVPLFMVVTGFTCL